MQRPDTKSLNDVSLFFKIIHEHFSPILTEVVKARELKDTQDQHTAIHNLDPVFDARDWSYLHILTPENISISEKEPKVFIHFTKDEHSLDVAECVYLKDNKWCVKSIPLDGYDHKNQPKFLDDCLKHINQFANGSTSSFETTQKQQPEETKTNKWANLKKKTAQQKQQKPLPKEQQKRGAYLAQDCKVINENDVCDCLKALEVKYFGSDADPKRINDKTLSVLLNIARKYQNYAEASGLLECLVAVDRKDLMHVSGKAAYLAAQVAFGGEAEGWDNRKATLHYLKIAYKKLGKDEFIKCGGPTLLRLVFNSYLMDYNVKIKHDGNGQDQLTDNDLMKQLKAGKDMFGKFAEMYAKTQGMSPTPGFSHAGAGIFKGAEKSKHESPSEKREYRK